MGAHRPESRVCPVHQHKRDHQGKGGDSPLCSTLMRARLQYHDQLWAQYKEDVDSLQEGGMKMIRGLEPLFYETLEVLL